MSTESETRYRAELRRSRLEMLSGPLAEHRQLEALAGFICATAHLAQATRETLDHYRWIRSTVAARISGGRGPVNGDEMEKIRELESLIEIYRGRLLVEFENRTGLEIKWPEVLK